jgi:hypothetical protein
MPVKSQLKRNGPQSTGQCRDVWNVLRADRVMPRRGRNGDADRRLLEWVECDQLKAE